MTKIDIYSGFLGAGKTTLIKKMIQEGYQGQKLVLIENEFGEIGIDGGFLQDAGINITEMNSGCICCSLVGDFGKALEQVIGEFHPDRILIEPSGVGKLSDVIGAVKKVMSDEVTLGYTVAVADAGKVKVYSKNFGEFYNNQIETASTIILSRTDAIPQAKLDTAVELLREHNQEATIVTTPWSQLTGAQLLAAMEGQSTLAAELAKLEQAHQEHHHHHDHDGECCCGHDHEHHHHDHEEGCCGHDHKHHHHDHEEGCCCGHDHEHHHHDHEEGCCCGHHDHEHHHHHEEGHCCGHHHGDEGCTEHHHGHVEEEHCAHHHGHHDHHHHDGQGCCGHDHHHAHHHHDEHCTCGCHDHDHHADEVFTSWGVETARKFSKELVEAALHSLDSGRYGMVLRAKGIVMGNDGSWIHFDYVPEEHNVRLGGADITGKLCVIGANLDEAGVAKLFGV